MGEKQNQSFQLSFNPCSRVDFQGSRALPAAGDSHWRSLGLSRALGPAIKKSALVSLDGYIVVDLL